MPLRLPDFVPIVSAFVLAVVLTPAVRALARRWGVVAQPQRDRWHEQPTALLGGVAIFLAVVVTQIAFIPLDTHDVTWLAGAVLLFAVGFVDDLLRIRPYQKFIGQLLGAVLVVFAGPAFSWTGLPLLDTVITLFWLVGITNALNLLDNMDGLSAGVAASRARG